MGILLGANGMQTLKLLALVLLQSLEALHDHIIFVIPSVVKGYQLGSLQVLISLCMINKAGGDSLCIRLLAALAALQLARLLLLIMLAS